MAPRGSSPRSNQYEYLEPARGQDTWGTVVDPSQMQYQPPPDGRGGDPAYGALPFGSTDQAGLSPAEQRALEIQVDSGVGQRLRQSRQWAPSTRRQTQGEIIDMSLLYGQLGNPFSVRRIPFSVLRDMLTDPMIYFALYYCLGVEERILTADLRWVPCGELKVGDKLLAFDEEVQSNVDGANRYGRRWQWSEVTCSQRAEKLCVRVWLEDGRSVVCTEDHPWLIGSTGGKPNDGADYGWRRAIDLVGSEVIDLLDTWDDPKTYEQGWLAGMLDGEGCLTHKRGRCCLDVSQKRGVVLDRLARGLLAGGFDFIVGDNPHSGVATLKVTTRPQVLKALGTLRPDRLLHKWVSQNGSLSECSIASRSRKMRVRVFAVERIGMQPIQSLSTSTGTYIGEGFAMHNTKVPMMRAPWAIDCADPQIAAAVDEALRPVNSRLQAQITNKLAWGYQPMCKRFKLGELRSFYRDARSADPEHDIPTWTSTTIKPLMWERPYVLAPEHCMPRWNDRGEFIGFYYSVVPIPNPVQMGVAALYGYTVVPGYEIPAEFAMWPVNEQDESMGSLFGSPRMKRAYRYYWSYWYRWALADRLFENASDPCKIVYYPTDYAEGIDVENPQGTMAVDAQQRALALGDQARQGATLALPGDFMMDESSGKMSSTRKWAIEYLEPHAAFDDLNKSFVLLDGLKFRAMLLPEEAFVQPSQGQRAARNVATQLGELYQESQQQLADENDEEINSHMIPQFIATNFPDRAGIPCKKVTTGFGSQDTDLMKQIITLVGQVKGETLPVDIREMFRQLEIPLLTEQQQKQQEEQIAKEAAASMPAVAPPEKTGMQGYNSGVEKTPDGTAFYYRGPETINLDAYYHGDAGSLLGNLPDVPAYKDASIRASMMKLRKIFLDRYKQQVTSFAQHLRERTTLRLAQQAAQGDKKGLAAGTAAGVAASLVGSWSGDQDVDSSQNDTKAILMAIAARAGKRELKVVNLSGDVFDPTTLAPWAASRAAFVVGSVDSTLTNELTTFLTDELQRDTDPESVAAAVEARFEDTAQTHAERVVKTETLPAYNVGALTAFKDAGVSQVQARDASDGMDQLTDAACKARDSKVFSVEQALKEEDHPNGTLYWVPLTTDNLTVERVESFPTHLHLNGDGDLLAHLDADSETLFLLEGVTDDQEREYRLAVGSVLALSG
jgi:hypothetical protein